MQKKDGQKKRWVGIGNGKNAAYELATLVKKEEVTTGSKLDRLPADVLREEQLTTLDYLRRRYEVVETLRKKTGRSVTIPKRRVRRITKVDIIFHTTCSEKPNVYYFTHGRQIDEECLDVLGQPNPFFKIKFTLGRGRELMQLQTKRKKPGYLTDTFNSAKTRDILCRLRVPYDEKQLKGKLDLTPDFWTIVVGRLVKDQAVKSKLIHYLEDNLRKRITTALLKEQKKVCEIRKGMYAIKLSSVLKEFPNLSLFEDFIAEKINEAMLEAPNIVKEVTEIKNELIKFYTQLQENLQNLITDLICLVILRRRIKWCKNLTYYLSPKTWKYEYAEESSKYISPFMDNLRLLKKRYLKYKSGDENIDNTVKILTVKLMNDIQNFGPFSMYFTKPLHLQSLLRDVDIKNVPTKLDIYYLTPKINEINSNIFKINYCIGKRLERINICKSKILNLYELSKKKREYYENEIKYYSEKSTQNIIGRPEGNIFIKLLFKQLYDFVVEYPRDESTLLGYLEAIETQIRSKLLFIEQCRVNNDLIKTAVDCVRDKRPTKFDRAEVAYQKRNEGFVYLKSIRNAIRPYIKPPLVRPLRFRSKISSAESMEDTYEDEIESEMNHLIHTTTKFRNKMKSKNLQHSYQVFDLENLPTDKYEEHSVLNLMDLSLVEDEMSVDEFIHDYVTTKEFIDHEGGMDIREISEDEQFYKENLEEQYTGRSKILIERSEISEETELSDEDKKDQQEEIVDDEDEGQQVEKYHFFDYSNLIPDFRK